jgi:hypothetical protein
MPAFSASIVKNKEVLWAKGSDKIFAFCGIALYSKN